MKIYNRIVKHRAAGIATALILYTLLLTTLGGCIKIVQQPTEPPTTVPAPIETAPQILFFSTSASDIRQGESITLSWQVSGTDEISILPDPGRVPASGTATVVPRTSITYTLSAENSAGTASKSLSISVEAEQSKADLVISRVFLETAQLYFVVKNIGNQPSRICRADLFIDGVKESNGEATVDMLYPGEEKTHIFDKFLWTQTFNPTSEYALPDKLVQYEVNVCIDATATVDELNEDNNCRIMMLGNLFTYTFYNKAHLAKWFSGAGELKLPVMETNAAGSVFTASAMVLENKESLSSIVATYPEPVKGGWISGNFADFYTDELHKAQIRPLELPRHIKFKATVGFSKVASPTARARFSFTLLDQSYTQIYSREIISSYDGAVEQFNEDLSAFAGKYCTMVLRVESMGEPGGDLAVWSRPVLTQDW